MPKKTSEPTALPEVTVKDTTVDERTGHSDATAAATVAAAVCHSEARRCTTVTSPDDASPGTTNLVAAPRTVNRGIAEVHSTAVLKDRIWTRALLMANRFRVIRTIDVAVCCFAERPYKASLSAAQRAIRGIVKAGLLKRYRTDRFQTVYGLTKGGSDWLEDAGFEAASSVRRVSDMTNPEHRLWAQFWTLACEARGMQAMSEPELLQFLNKDVKSGQPLVQGMLTVTSARGQKTNTIQLRPDAVAFESDGLTWLEVDRSKRGTDREASLAALTNSVGRILRDGSTLRRVVVFCKTERIYKRALAVVNGLAEESNERILTLGRRHFRELSAGTFAVWTAVEVPLGDGRTQLVDTLVGHVIVQLLPIWLPKVRIDASNTHSMVGWFDEDYLPYRRPPGTRAWDAPSSPLGQAISGGKVP